jgi:hypothetical protein
VAEKGSSSVGRSFIGGFMGFLGVIAAIIVLIIAVGILVHANSQTQEAQTQSALQSSTPAQSESAPFKTYNLQEPFNVSGHTLFASDSGDYNWNIKGVDLSKKESITAYNGSILKPTSGKYYLFFINAVNAGKEKQDMSYGLTNDLILITKDGVKYSPDDNSTLTTSIEGDESYFSSYYDQRQVNPGNTAKDYAIFDVPDGAYKLCQKELKTFCVDIP